MAAIEQNVQEALKHYFGFDQFKGNQEEIIESILNQRDTFVIMPTGGGKSLCYQLPALMLEGTALVISPLIALMKNQVDSIRSFGNKESVAHFLNSSLTRVQAKRVKQDILSGETKLLYVAPETLTKEENLQFFSEANISFVAVDEAHCISEWGHDFRPEYRRIRSMIDSINKSIPLIALTATATPKVRTDIIKTLDMREPNSFVSSFNRPNLYYEVRPKGKKEDVLKNIIQFVKTLPRESGIIYVQSRKSAEEIAKVLQVNDVRAAPYHAGLDPKRRSNTQDDFLKEEVDVIVATIAFGMGIDKPDVRFVIHYDIPKSIENYYQETGRAGRDGQEGKCIAYYSYKDIARLEKFLRDKSVAEREMGAQLLNEMMAYSETTACRRRFLLHYFGEQYTDDSCREEQMCDNCKYPREQVEVQEEIQLGLKTVLALHENQHLGEVVDVLLGKETQLVSDYKFNQLDLFGAGSEKDEHFWKSALRQALLDDLLYKDIEQYGLLKLTQKGRDYLENPQPFQITLSHDFVQELKDAADEAAEAERTAVLDRTLYKMLLDVRKKVARRKNVPPFVVFPEASIEEMATRYPFTPDEMQQITGISRGKALRYGRDFVSVIKKYVEENEIERPTEVLVKSIAKKSKSKVSIIQSIDRKIPLEDIAQSLNMSMDDLLQELFSIVYSGTKLDIDYYIEENVDEYAQEEIEDYFQEDAESPSLDDAFAELSEDDITMEEIQLIRIKYFSDKGN